jgi:hypothetical protein
MFVAIAGMFVLVGPNFATGGRPLLGDALGALTAVFYGSYLLAIKAARDARASTARLMAWSTTITAIALLPVALLMPQPFQTADGSCSWAGTRHAASLIGSCAHLPASLPRCRCSSSRDGGAFAWALFGEAIGPVHHRLGAWSARGETGDSTKPQLFRPRQPVEGRAVPKPRAERPTLRRRSPRTDEGRCGSAKSGHLTRGASGPSAGRCAATRRGAELELAARATRTSQRIF